MILTTSKLYTLILLLTPSLMFSLKKITLTLGTLGLLTLGASILPTSSPVKNTVSPTKSVLSELAVPTASANPDYICVKSVSGGPCVVSSWSPWVNQSRTGFGSTVTQVVYYSVRIGCVEGGAGTIIGDTGGASGRRT